MAEILLVDDNPADIALMAHAFDSSGRRVTMHAVENVMQALSFLGAQGGFVGNRLPDLILMDVNLPLIDGTRAVRIIKETGRWSAVPIVMLSALEDPLVRDRCLEAGATSFVRKPRVWEDCLTLARMIVRHLDSGLRPSER